jgi:hypothetical protein
MDSITYRGVLFPVVNSINWERDEMLDPSGTTYLYTRWRGNAIVTYNPGALAASVANVVGNAPVIGTRTVPPIMPAQTDVAIRSWICRPRGQLIVVSAGRIVVSSPSLKSPNGTLAPCDATVGPTLKIQTIVKIPGERRWDIHLSFETCVVERFPGTPVVMSNRWYVSSETNWQQVTTRTYQGLVTVRGDALRYSEDGVTAAIGNIDALRNSFAAFSVPFGYQRTGVAVRVMPDGNSAEYTVVDTQQQWNKGLSCPAVRVDVQDSGWVLRRSALWSLGSAFSAATLPKANKKVHVRAWGVPGADRLALVRFAIGTAILRIGGENSAFTPTTDEIIVAADTNNYVDVVLTRSWDYASVGLLITGALIVASVTTTGNVPAGTRQFINSLMQTPTINTVGNFGVNLSQAVGSNPNFQSNGTRGPNLGTLVTQILENPDQAPLSVP